MREELSPLGRTRSLACIRWLLFIVVPAEVTSRGLSIITKCETVCAEDQLRKFQPRSDFHLSKSDLPRLLVEVNSKPMTEWPADLVRMLVTGAAVVRFANGFLDRFMMDKNFVLCAMYIWGNGKVTRYSLFQDPYNPEVCWTSFITKLGG